jgi:AraC family transcriptional regulator
VKAYDSIVKLLAVIENRAADKMSVEWLARYVHLSGSHLQKLFKITAGQPLMEYVRGRKLAYSLDTLFNTDLHILDIAYEYGFEHEQSYIRAFSKEFGCTPGEARKTKLILPIRERIDPKRFHSFNEGFIYGPEIVMAPPFSIIGKPHKFTGFDSQKDALEPNKLAIKFKNEEMNHIPNMINPVIYVGYNNILSVINNKAENIEYMPSVLVKDLSCVPGGLKGLTIPTHQCARFRYIGEHHYEEINMVTAKSAYFEIDSFLGGQSRYAPLTNYFVEWLDTSAYDGAYCQFEWLFPVKDTVK